MSAWKPILAALVIFAAGVTTGALALRLASPRQASVERNPDWTPNLRGARGEFLKRMDRELDLTQEQRDRIDQMLRESQERTRQLWDGVAPQVQAEQKRIRERIREELTAEQRAKFDESFRNRLPGRHGTEGRRQGDRPGSGRSRESLPDRTQSPQ